MSSLHTLAFLSVALVAGSRASAQTMSFNLDIGAGAVPADTYAAAAAQPGHWMGVAADTPFVSIPLTNIHGAATLATLNYNSGFDFYADNPNTSGDDAALFDDTQGAFAVSYWDFANLRPGDYEVWSYAWAPDSPIFFKTRVVVTGSSDPAQVVGGHDWTGTFVQGWHYARHRVTVGASGTLEIVFSVAVSACTVNGVQLRELAPPPEVYCTAGTSTHGCVGSISGAGAPSASASSGFLITAANVPAQRLGMILYGDGGRASTPWGTGTSTLCLGAPLQRTGAQLSGGTAGACDGAYVLDWNAFMTTHTNAVGQPRAAGQVFQAQAWYRDTTAPLASNLSDALEFTLVP